MVPFNRKEKVGGEKGKKSQSSVLDFLSVLFRGDNQVEISRRDLETCMWNSEKRAELGMESSAGRCY